MGKENVWTTDVQWPQNFTVHTIDRNNGDGFLFYGSTYFENSIQGLCLDYDFLLPHDVAGRLVDKQTDDYNLFVGEHNVQAPK